MPSTWVVGIFSCVASIWWLISCEVYGSSSARIFDFILFISDTLITERPGMSLSHVTVIFPQLVSTCASHDSRQTQCSSSSAVGQARRSWPSLALRTTAIDRNVVPCEARNVDNDIEHDGYQPRGKVDQREDELEVVSYVAFECHSSPERTKSIELTQRRMTQVSIPLKCAGRMEYHAMLHFVFSFVAATCDSNAMFATAHVTEGSEESMREN
jgi:hypothetical protein